MKENKIESKTENIYTALLKVQESGWLVKKDSSNPFFKSKYADLEAVSHACRALLNKAGIVVIQLPLTLDNKAGCKTLLVHSESGTTIENELLLPLAKNDPQAAGSCITYARRYSLASIIGLVASEEDDDGNAASGKTTETKPQAKPALPPKVYIKDDEVPEYDIFTPYEIGTVPRFGYDVSEASNPKLAQIMTYLKDMRNNTYIYYDKIQHLVFSDSQLPKLANYQMDLT
jgi:hypothetical protein